MTLHPDVTTDAVIDVDHHDDAFNRDEVRATAEIRRRCPVAWNKRYGGFWFVTGYDAVSKCARDGETFAHKFEPDAADGIDYQGEIGIPRPAGQPALGIGEVDGPYHQALRRGLAPFFSPRAIQKARPFMEQSVDWFIDQHIEDGHVDLVLDYASPVPAILTMQLMGLPYDNWKMYSDLFHNTIAFHEDSPQYRTAIAQVPEMMAGLAVFCAQRRENPRDDLTSFLVQFEHEGQHLSDGQLLDILWNLVGGGVDTTTSLTSLSLRHLAHHDELRQKLIVNPELYSTASDEFLRYFSVNQTLSRTVTQDTVLGGQQLRRNDRVLVSWLAANHDDTVFDRPDEVVPERTPNQHVAFGLGAHRCIGGHLARAMFEVMVRGVLERIPDYRVATEGIEEYLGSPSMTGLNRLPATFTAGTSLGTKRPY